MTANYTADIGSVSVLLGNGSGSFGAKTDFATGRYPTSVAVGDINGDGKQDLVTADWGGGGVSVLLQELATFTITPSVVGGAGGHGTISPASVQTVDWHSTPTFTFTPANGYHVGAVKVDGATVTMTGTNQYTFPAVTANHTISVMFAIDTFTITPSVVGGTGGHGTISPASVQTVNWHSTPTFTFTPAATYHVGEVRVDGTLVTMTGTNRYTFPAITADHTISVSFAIDTFTITPSVVGGASGHGTISPATPWTVEYGATPWFAFTPDASYHVSKVRVDGALVTTTQTNEYAFPAVTANHTISVAFALNPKPTLGKPICPKSVKHGKQFKVHGTLSPRFAAGAKTVKVKAYRNVNGKWKLYKSYAAINADSGNATKYTAKVKLDEEGQVPLQGEHGRDGAVPRRQDRLQQDADGQVGPRLGV